MDATQRAEFVRNYMRLLAAVWADESFERRLHADPRRALGEYLIDVPDDATVDLVGTTTDPDVEQQADLWAQGEETGTYKLEVPEPPELETRELSDEDLASIAAGSIL